MVMWHAVHDKNRSVQDKEFRWKVWESGDEISSSPRMRQVMFNLYWSRVQHHLWLTSCLVEMMRKLGEKARHTVDPVVLKCFP